jgi:hypothetical protein
MMFTKKDIIKNEQNGNDIESFQDFLLLLWINKYVEYNTNKRFVEINYRESFRTMTI